MGKKSSVSGTILEPNGSTRKSWVGFVELPKGADGKRRRRKITGSTRSEVQSSIDAVVKTIEAGQKVDRLTIGAWLASWLEEVSSSGDVSPTTIANHRWCVAVIGEQIGASQLDALTDGDVRKMLDKLGKTNAKTMLVRFRYVLCQALDVAVSRRLVAVNVALTVKIPKKTKATRPRRSLTVLQSRAVVAWLREQTSDTFQFRAAVAVQLATGCRPGEVLALRWPDVDLVEGSISITGSLLREPNDDGVGMRVVRGKTKTVQSVRAVRLPTWATEIVAAHRDDWEAAAAALLGTDWVDHGYVFPSERAHGDLFDPKTYRVAVQKMATTLGLGDLTPHELRHAHASVLLDAGETLETVADRLGHKSTRVTETVYKHRLSEVIEGGTATAELLG